MAAGSLDSNLDSMTCQAMRHQRVDKTTSDTSETKSYKLRAGWPNLAAVRHFLVSEHVWCNPCIL